MISFKQLFYESAKPDELETIKKSIKNRNTILFYYEGDNKIAKGFRWVEPVAFGFSKDGNGLLRAFQIKDKPSKSGHKPSWRLFKLIKLKRCQHHLKNLTNQEKDIIPMVINVFMT